MANYLLYSGKAQNLIDLSDGSVQIKFNKLRPLSKVGKGRIANLYWWLISRKIYIAQVFDSQTGELMHYSYVMKKTYKFPFMGKHDYMIGPSVTMENHRKKGAFTKAVTFAQNDIVEKDSQAVFIALIREENLASRKGVEKCGLENTGRVYQKNKFKIYKQVNNQEKE